MNPGIGFCCLIVLILTIEWYSKCWDRLGDSIRMISHGGMHEWLAVGIPKRTTDETSLTDPSLGKHICSTKGRYLTTIYSLISAPNPVGWESLLGYKRLIILSQISSSSVPPSPCPTIDHQERGGKKKYETDGHEPHTIDDLRRYAHVFFLCNPKHISKPFFVFVLFDV